MSPAQPVLVKVITDLRGSAVNGRTNWKTRPEPCHQSLKVASENQRKKQIRKTT